MNILAKLFVIAALSIPILPTVAEAKPIEVIDFESRNFSQWRNPDGGGGKEGEREIVTNPVRSGRYAAKYCKNGATRSESAGKIFRHGEEYWYAYSILLPQNYETVERGQSTFQVRNKGTGGLLQIIAREDGGKDYWGYNLTSSAEKIRRKNLAPLQKGKWTDVVINAKWHTSDGFLKMWIDGKQVLDRRGSTYPRGKEGVMVKAGIYSRRSDNERSLRNCAFFDNIITADSSSSLQEIAGRAFGSGGGSSDRTNLALNRPVRVSAQPQSANPAKNLTNGKTNDRWSAKGYPNWLEVDLGRSQSVSSLELHSYEGRAYQFVVRDSKGKILADRRNNRQGGDKIVVDFNANTPSIRVEITGCHGSSCSNWVSIQEVKVY